MPTSSAALVYTTCGYPLVSAWVLVAVSGIEPLTYGL